MSKAVKVLIVEDSEDDVKLALRALRQGGFDPTSRRVQTAAEFEAALAEEPWDAVISDYKMPGFTGLDALRIFRSTGLDIPFILVSGTIGEEIAVEAMKAGASDYVMKQSLVRLAPALDRELEETKMRAALRRDQKDLRDSQERYRSLFEASIDAVLLTDPDGRVLAANPSACRMFDLTGDEIRQGGRTRLVDPSDPRLALALEERSRTGRFMGELTFVRKDGATFPGDISTAVFRDKDGQARTSMIIRDVTGRKEAENNLLASELRFRQMAENIRDVFFLLDADGTRMLYASPAYEEIWGRTRVSLYANSESWIEAIHPDDRALAEEKYKQGLLAGTAEFAFRIVRPDGSIRQVEIRAFPVRDDAGEIIRIAGVATDITERTQALEVTLQLTDRLTTTLESITDAFFTVDREWRFTFLNREAERLLARTRAELNGRNLWKEFPDTIGSSFEREYRRAMEDNKTVDFEEFYLPLNTWFGVRAYPSAQGLAVYFRDISERKTAERRIAYLNRVYAVLSDINTLIVRVRERDELFKEACRIAVDKGGFHIALIAIVDRSTMTIVPVATAGVDERFLALLKDRFSLIEGAPSGNPVMTRAIQDKRPVVINNLESNPDVVFRQRYVETGIRSVAVFPLIVSDEAAGVLVLYAEEREFFHDEEMKLLTELAGDIAFAIDHIEKRERLDYLAYYDVLTGLANRSLFLERVTQYVRSAGGGGHKLAIFLIDVERFKNINDSLGRPAGDALLRQVAEWLTHSAGDANLVARLGADHFAAVLPEVKRDGDAGRLLDNMMATFLEHAFRLNDAVFRINAKVGAALFPDDGVDAETLFRHAEAALKKAKAIGERYLFYRQEMTEKVAGKLTLENQLRQALDNEEFVLHYQPKVSLASGKMTSAEALIRWNDPRTGLVPPGRFIPVLEETGLIYEVGRWALRQAITDYLRWKAAGLAAVRIAVNVSPLQLRNRGFVDEIRQVIGIDAQAPAGLELEITESLIMEDVKHSIASLQAIRAMDVCIAIDDFGTGFSSLSYLAKLPVHTLKIDRSFVIEMTTAREGLALVSTIISLAHALRLKVVAEGVETEEQSRLLRLLSCDEMQGFLFSKPVPVEIFESRFLVPASGAAGA